MLPGQSTGIGAPAGTVYKQPSATQLWQRRARRLATRGSHNSTSGRQLARPATQGELTGMIRHRLALIAGVAAALAMLPAAASAAAVHGSYTTIDVLGAADTIGLGINDCGVVVGFYDDSHGNDHGFIDLNGAFKRINFPGAVGTVADGINDKGVVIGTYAAKNGVNHGFLDHHGHLTEFNVPGAGTGPGQGTVGAVINNHAVIAGTYID